MTGVPVGAMTHGDRTYTGVLYEVVTREATVVVAVCAVLAAAAVFAAMPPAPRRPLVGAPRARAAPGEAGAPARRGAGVPPGLLAAGAAGAAAIGTVSVFPGPVGLLGAVGAGAFTYRRVRSREPAGARAARLRAQAELPVAADLLAACLAAGIAPADAVDAVVRAVGGPVGDRLGPVAAALRLGGDPVACWGKLATDPELAPLARAMARAETTGAAPSDTVARVADACRQAQARAATAAARAVGVRATVPLGVCFLPAFLLVGVVPVVAGLAGALMGP